MNEKILMSVNHPIIQNHRVLGQHVLPGLAWIDFVFQFFRKRGFRYSEIELRNLAIFRPLIVGADFDVLLDVEATQQSADQWRLVVQGEERRGGASHGEMRRYMAADVHRVDPIVLPGHLDVELLKRTADSAADLAGFYAGYRTKEVLHDGLMRASGKAYAYPHAVCLDLRLSDASLASKFMFHPTLLDASAVCGGAALESANKAPRQQLVLPLSFESFRASALLQRRCYVRLAFQAASQKPDLSCVSIEFFDERGRKNAELKNLACKVVRDAGAFDPARRAPPGSDREVPAPSKHAPRRSAGSRPAPKADAGVFGFMDLLRTMIATKLERPADEIDSGAGFYEMGLDSAGMLELLEAVAGRVSESLPPTLPFEFGNIDALSGHLAARYGWRDAAADSAPRSAQTQDSARDSAKASAQAPAQAPAQDSTQAPSAAACAPDEVPVVPASPIQSTPRSEPKPECAEQQAPDAAAIGNTDVAIIGMSGKFPGASDIDAFWNNLKAGVDCVTVVPDERWDRSALPQVRSVSGKSTSQWGGFIDHPDYFDSQFFRVAPREAALLDPQERLFLEVSWEAIEDAGYTPKTLVASQGDSDRRQVGVFVGVMHKDYALLGLEAMRDGHTFPLSLNYAPIPNRVSYFCNFHGPSMAIDTVCSASLTAVHLAAESVRSGESEVAIAGGVNLSLHPAKYVSYGLADMHSTDGRCRTFGTGGDGYVSGEAVGAVVLKPLRNAIRDGDHIYAVIKGSGVNHVGAVSGITVPSSVAQADLIATTLKKANISPRTLSYIEAHGTGTSLGDPIEIEGLTRAIRRHTPDTRFCAIGSVKSNIGHAEAAAGITGLIKVALQLHHQTLVPSLHSQELNPYIDWEHSPFVVQRVTEPWEAPITNENGRELSHPRRAAVSSFGATGSNAHVVLEEHRPDNLPVLPLENAPDRVLVPLTARSDERLLSYAARLLQFIESREISLSSLAYTLQVGREAFEARVAFVVSDIEALKSQLKAFVQKEPGLQPFVVGSTRKKGESRTPVESEEDTAERVARWIAKSKLPKLAKFWVDGGAFDWTLLHGTNRPPRVSLPTYPFARESHWLKLAPKAVPKPVPKADPKAAPDRQPIALSPSQDPATELLTELMTFEESWHERQLLAGARNEKSRVVLCLLSGSAAQAEFAGEVAALDPQATVIFASQAERYGQLSDRHFGLVRSDGATYREMLRRVQEQHGRIDTALYLWGLEAEECLRDSSPIVHLVQALGNTEATPCRVVLAGPYRDDLNSCYVDSWVGFERSIRWALPGLEIAVLCHDDRQSQPEANAVAMQEWAQRIWAELGAEKIETSLHRDGQRYVLRRRRTEIPATRSLAIRKGGTYVITGGAGGLGLLFAEYLARQHSANLILTGRSVLSAEKQEKIAALERWGGRVTYVSVDVCDVRQMREALAPCGPINGVIHAAGVTNEETVATTKLVRFRAVLAPKVAGTIAIDEALRDSILDFVCYFASSSAVLGDFGSCDYAIGNRFQIAYARYRNRLDAGKSAQAGQAIAIAWPLWQDGGMKLEADGATQLYLTTSGQRTLRADEGFAIFERLLEADSGCLVMVGAPERVDRFLDAMPDSGTPPQPVNHPASSSAAAPVARHGSLKGLTIAQCVASDLKDTVSAILGLAQDSIQPDENLANFGFDSLSLMEFAKQLTQRYGIKFTPALFFSHTTLEKLEDFLVKDHGAVMQALYAPAASAALTPPSSLGPLPARPLEPTAPSKQEAGVSTASPGYESIAVIGMSGRFPKAQTTDELWKILAEGRDVIGEIPAERFDWRQHYDSTPGGKRNISSKWLAAVAGVGDFDAGFFEISPREAELIDPRQRLLLQEAWKALEDAAYGAKHLEGGKVGIFVGVEQGDYQRLADGGAAVMSNHDGILAARLAYFLNLHGPAMAINTACSSGLVAAHQACASLRAGECDTAIAAAANLLLTPHIYAAMSDMGMLSPDGRCWAFDRRANGIVPGEAIVALVLKRLSCAVADGDPIHAVIRGTGVNYDGKTNGITAPSGAAQTDLVRDVLARAGVRPNEIGCIFAHGTGTRLGDPVEVNALKDAFKADPPEAASCALVSTKANVGHTFAASGLVSLVAAVQALRHETIPASLHCEEENDYIDWQDSPFYINKTGSPWPKRGGRARLAGVSAFGISGTNAHALIGEYEAQSVPGSQAAAPYFLLALSAKTSEALAQKVGDLRQVLEAGDWDAASLAALSCTLLCGRLHFDHRFAVVAADREHAVRLLEKVGSRERAPNRFRNTVAQGFSGQHAIRQYAEDLIGKTTALRGDLDQYLQALYALADLYCQGYELPWDRLWGRNTPRRLHLPTYPFAAERHWMPDREGGERGQARAVGSSQAAQIHPLLHRNTSDISGLRFSSNFSGEEFFLRDHVVKTAQVLPGVAYLEMARAAVEEAGLIGGATAELAKEHPRVLLKGVTWLRPTVVAGPTEMHIRLYPLDANSVEYEVYTLPEGDAEGVIRAYGSAQIAWSAEDERPHVDLEHLKQACQRTITSESCYSALDGIGLRYGAGMRGLTALHVGTDPAAFVLGEIRLPECIADSASSYVLHPSVMDSALQAVLGLYLTPDPSGAQSGGRTHVPYSLDELEIFGAPNPHSFVYVRRAVGPADNGHEKLDVDVCDESGEVWARLKGMGYRAWVHAEEATPARVLLSSQWQEKPLPLQASPTSSVDGVAPAGLADGLALGDHWVLLDPLYKECVPQLQRQGVRCEVLRAEELAPLEQRVNSYAVQLLQQVQKILLSKPNAEVLLQVLVVRRSAEDEALRALSGMLKSAHQENPKLIGQLIEVDEQESAESALLKLQANARTRADTEVRYEGGTRYVRQLKELAAGEVTKPWKDDGVYLISGGAGGLGRILAQEIFTQVSRARVIVTGRRELDETQQQQLRELQARDGQIEYVRLDVTDESAVHAAVQAVLQRHGRLNGVIHAAGVIKDNFAIRKSEEELLEVLGPKVQGTVNLDRATREVGLESFILCSSLAGALGNVGQSDYALGNAFMDAYAQYRSQLVSAGECSGRTLTVNWPLWEHGGMGLDAATAQRLKSHGMMPLSTVDGLQALYEAYGSESVQVLVVSTNTADRARVAVSVLSEQAEAEHSTHREPNAGKAEVVSAEITEDELRERTIAYLKKQLAEHLKCSPDRLEADAPLEKYGIDSILSLQMTQLLERQFGGLSKTLFFEYQTIGELAGYFIRSHRDALTQQLKLRERAVSAGEVRDAAPAKQVARREFKRVRHGGPDGAGRQGSESPQSIAIVGLSGRYAQAKDVTEYWENLKAGKDCITEIPAHRWDHSEYFDAQKGKLGKTYSKWGGFMDGVDQFDPLFFNISPLEAQVMDPQERLFLQCVYETLEDAGYTRDGLKKASATLGVEGNVGVFVGVMYEEYQLYGAQAQSAGNAIALGGNPSSIANRVSYQCNFHGPSMAVDTMCSSSLTAIHLACQSLQQGGCEVAIAGGVNVSIHPNKYLMLSQGQFASSSGRCESFGKGGDGYVPGEGVGAVMLKPLSRALADGDQIYGQILATSINHGGKTNGYTVPSPQAQRDVIQTALKKAGVPARAISYIEAHGTGTSLGDPIEIAGLRQAFEHDTAEKQFCAIGSVKSNIGHCESAAGMAALTKVLLQMKHGVLVPSLHSETLNPHIDFANTPFVVQRELSAWERPRIGEGAAAREYPRIAGISSFGAGGSNAHVIVQEHAAVRPAVDEPEVSIVVLSAHSDAALQQQARRLLNAVSGEAMKETRLADVAYTLQVGREAMEHRLALTVSAREQLLEKLEKYLQGEKAIEDVYRGEVKPEKDVLAMLNADEGMSQAVETWIARGQYTKLAQLWAKGLTLDWQRLYGQGSPRRISLPTYPFEQERYWIGDAGIGVRTMQPAQARRSIDREALAVTLNEWLAEKIDLKVAASRTREVLLARK